MVTTTDNIYLVYYADQAHEKHNEKDEEWRLIDDWPYEVSSLGRVRRLFRGGNGQGGKPLKPQPCGPNFKYRFVLLSYDGRRHSFLLHRLVAEAFLGPRPPGLDIDHIDNDPANCAAANLRYVTTQDNIKKSITNGHRGKSRWNAKLTEAAVMEIRAMRLGGHHVSDISRLFGVSEGAVYHVIRGDNWKHAVKNAE